MNLISTLSKTIHCFLIKNCSLFSAQTISSILHKIIFCSALFKKKNHSIFYVNYILFTIQKIVHCFLIKHLVKSCFLFMFEFDNNQIYFSALIKSISTLIKFSLCTSYLLYIQICLLHS